MNRFDAYITDYLFENKEVSLDRIGIVKTSAASSEDVQAASVEFICNKKIATTTALVNYIAEREHKNKFLIASDLESHFAQVREFLNIGKNYEIPSVGFIRSNKSGTYEFLPYSEANKPGKIVQQTVKQPQRSSKRSFVQLITVIIVIAILVGLGWQAYNFFNKPQTDTVTDSTVSSADSTTVKAISDTNKKTDTSTVAPQPVIYSDTDVVNAKYIFETTASLLRAQTRTSQLKGFGSNAGYDSFITNKTKFYSLYILKPTKIADTLSVRDSLGKFLMRDIKVEIEP